MEGVGHREDVRPVDGFHHLKVLVELGLAADGNACVGDHDVSAAGKGLELLCGRNDLILFRHVGGNRVVARLVAGKRVDEGLQLFWIAGDEPEDVASLRILAGKCRADAA